MRERAAKIGNWVHRLSTVGSLALAVSFFVGLGWSNMGVPRQVLFLLWIAYAGFATIKILVDMVGGGHTREERFAEMLGRWEESAGGRGAMGMFGGITAVTALVKLAVPFLLRFV